MLLHGECLRYEYPSHDVYRVYLRGRTAVPVDVEALTDLPRTALSCVLLAPALDRDPEPRLLDLRVAFLWSAAVPAAGHLAAGTNTYRPAADTLGLSVQLCLVASPAADTGDAATSGARVVLASRAGELTRLAKSPSALSDMARDVAQLLALGHSATSAAAVLGKSHSTVVTQAWKLNQRYGYPASAACLRFERSAAFATRL